jgi:hypothetical protein
VTVIDLAAHRATGERLENLLLEIEKNLRNKQHDVAVTNFCHALFLAHRVRDTERLASLRRSLGRQFGGFSDTPGAA